MYRQATAPRSMGSVLDASSRLYSASFRDALPLSAALAILSCAPSLLLMERGGSGDLFGFIATFFSAPFLFAVALSGLASIACSVALVVVIEDVAQGRAVRMGAALDRGLERLPTAIVSSLLYGVIVVVGLVLCLVPGIVFMLSMSFALPAIALDDKAAIESLSYSHRLVWGEWWHTASVLGIGLLVPLLVGSLGPSIGVAIAGMLVTSDPERLLIVETVLTAVASFLIAPYVLALMLEVYRDLKLRASVRRAP